MTLQFTVLELSCLLHIRLQEELVRFAMKKKTYSILHVLFSNSSLFENVFGRVILLKMYVYALLY